MLAKILQKWSDIVCGFKTSTFSGLILFIVSGFADHQCMYLY